MVTHVQAEARGDECGALLAFLDAQRGGVRRAVLGLTREQAVARPSASALTLGGLVKHLAEVEEGWVCDAKGVPRPVRRDPGDWLGSFRLEEDETVDWALAYWERVAADTEAFARGLDHLDAAFALPKAPWFPEGDRSMRWLLLHLIEETARHAGHADVIRESLDGRSAIDLVAQERGCTVEELFA